MIPYKNLEGHSGVSAYKIAQDRISITFGTDATYIYTYKSAGKKVVEKMKQLAAEGRGLSTYISQSAKDKFESKSEL